MFSQNVVDTREVIAANKPDFWDSQPFSQQWANSQTASQQTSVDMFSQHSAPMATSGRIRGVGSDYWSQSNSSQTSTERRQESYHARFMERSPLFPKRPSEHAEERVPRSFNEFLNATRNCNMDRTDSSLIEGLFKNMKMMIRDSLDEMKTLCASIQENVTQQIESNKSELLSQFEKKNDVSETLKTEILDTITSLKDSVCEAVQTQPALEKIIELIKEQGEHESTLDGLLKNTALAAEKAAEVQSVKIDQVLEQGNLVMENMKQCKFKKAEIYIEKSAQTEVTSEDITASLLRKKDSLLTCNKEVQYDPKISFGFSDTKRCSKQLESEESLPPSSCKIELGFRQYCSGEKQNTSPTTGRSSIMCQRQDLVDCERSQKVKTFEKDTSWPLYKPSRESKQVALSRTKRGDRCAEKMLNNMSMQELVQNLQSDKNDDPSNIFTFELATSDSEEEESVKAKIVKCNNVPERTAKVTVFKNTLVKDETLPNHRVQQSIRHYGKIVRSSSGQTKRWAKISKDVKTIKQGKGRKTAFKSPLEMVGQMIPKKKPSVRSTQVYEEYFGFTDEVEEVTKVPFTMETRKRSRKQ